MPEVSVIVPNYNHGKYLPRRLESILDQKYQDFEIILLDDCSTDNSVKILTYYSQNEKVKYFLINKTNSGSPFKQWAKGIMQAKGEYIWIAESDDESDPEFLTKVITPLKLDQNIALCYCQSWNLNESGEKTGNWINHTDDIDPALFGSNFRYSGTDFVIDFMLQKNVIPNASAVVFRKSLYEKAGGIDTRLKYCGDWLLWMKLCVLSDIYFISESLNSFRRHENSVIYKAITTDFRDKFYLLKSDKKMREYFSLWLKEQPLDFTSIIKKNQLYIDNAIKEEAFYYIWEVGFLKSCIFSLRYFKMSRDFSVLAIPFRRLPFIIFKPIKKVLERLRIS
jgi:glycosyltransferase involved in cell wall biosynthesis